jgi:hypothetical protein
MPLQYVLPPLVMSLLGLIMRYHTLQRRNGNIPVRMRQAGKNKWSRGNAVWVHDVFAFRASPAAWRESLFWVADTDQRAPTAEERRKLHRLGDDMAIATFHLNDGDVVDVATRRENVPALFGDVAKRRDVATSQEVIEGPRLQLCRRCLQETT